MLSKRVKERIRANRLYRQIPAWQWAWMHYWSHQGPGAQALLSSKHLDNGLNEAVDAAYRAQIKRRDYKLDHPDRAEWNVLKPTLPPSFRWSPRQARRTLDAMHRQKVGTALHFGTPTHPSAFDDMAIVTLSEAQALGLPFGLTVSNDGQPDALGDLLAVTFGSDNVMKPMQRVDIVSDIHLAKMAETSTPVREDGTLVSPETLAQFVPKSYQRHAFEANVEEIRRRMPLNLYSPSNSRYVMPVVGDLVHQVFGAEVNVASPKQAQPSTLLVVKKKGDDNAS